MATDERTEIPPDEELRRLAELLVWAGENTDESWDYATDAQPDSAYAKWVRYTSPATVLSLLDRIGQPEFDVDAMAAALGSVWERMQRGDMSTGGPNGAAERSQWARTVIEHYLAHAAAAGVAPSPVGGTSGE